VESQGIFAKICTFQRTRLQNVSCQTRRLLSAPPFTHDPEFLKIAPKWGGETQTIVFSRSKREAAENDSLSTENEPLIVILVDKLIETLRNRVSTIAPKAMNEKFDFLVEKSPGSWEQLETGLNIPQHLRTRGLDAHTILEHDLGIPVLHSVMLFPGLHCTPPIGQWPLDPASR